MNRVAAPSAMTWREPATHRRLTAAEGARAVHAMQLQFNAMCQTVESLNANLKANRAAINWLRRADPALWEDLKTRTQARRAELAARQARAA